ncbi:MAG: hypothetical protein LBQ50_08560, partial [Planctomycetaceae bacterium]|nr:hypothetical protein [Planctomycetaceae bacterium]
TLDAIFGNSAAVRKIHYLQFQKEQEYKKVLSENATLFDRLKNENIDTLNAKNINTYKNILELRDFLVDNFGAGSNLEN